MNGPNENDPGLRLHFILETSDDLSPSELRNLGNCIEGLVFDVASHEAIFLLREAGAPGNIQQLLSERLPAFPARAALPIGIQDVRRGSWEILLSIPIAAMALWVLQNTIGDTLKEAYAKSKLREATLRILQFNIGRRARHAADQHASANPSYGNLSFKHIEDTHDLAKSPADGLVIQLERREVLSVHLSYEELVRDFERKHGIAE